MTLFEVHCKQGTRRKAIPFVVKVQSGLFDHYQRRMVVPRS